MKAEFSVFTSNVESTKSQSSAESDSGDTPTDHTGKLKFWYRKNGRFDAEIIIIVKLYYVKVICV